MIPFMNQYIVTHVGTLYFFMMGVPKNNFGNVHSSLVFSHTCLPARKWYAFLNANVLFYMHVFPHTFIEVIIACVLNARFSMHAFQNANDTCISKACFPIHISIQAIMVLVLNVLFPHMHPLTQMIYAFLNVKVWFYMHAFSHAYLQKDNHFFS